MDERVIGETIRAIRETKGVTLTEIAELAGISKGALSKIEHAQVSVPISTLLRIAQALNVHPRRFFTKPRQTLDMGANREQAIRR